MSRTTKKFGKGEGGGEMDVIETIPFSLEGKRLHPLLFTTSMYLPEPLEFTFFPNELGVKNLVRAIKQRCGEVVKYDDTMDGDRDHLVILINTPYLLQSTNPRIKNLLLPNDAFDLSFIIDMIAKDGKGVDLKDYRFTASEFEEYSPHDLLMKKISRKELRRLAKPPLPQPLDKNIMITMGVQNADITDSQRDSNDNGQTAPNPVEPESNQSVPAEGISAPNPVENDSSHLVPAQGTSAPVTSSSAASLLPKVVLHRLRVMDSAFFKAPGSSPSVSNPTRSKILDPKFPTETTTAPTQQGPKTRAKTPTAPAPKGPKTRAKTTTAPAPAPAPKGPKTPAKTTTTSVPQRPKTPAKTATAPAPQRPKTPDPKVPAGTPPASQAKTPDPKVPAGTPPASQAKTPDPKVRAGTKTPAPQGPKTPDPKVPAEKTVTTPQRLKTPAGKLSTPAPSRRNSPRKRQAQAASSSATSPSTSTQERPDSASASASFVIDSDINLESEDSFIAGTPPPPHQTGQAVTNGGIPMAVRRQKRAFRYPGGLGRIEIPRSSSSSEDEREVNGQEARRSRGIGIAHSSPAREVDQRTTSTSTSAATGAVPIAEPVAGPSSKRKLDDGAANGGTPSKRRLDIYDDKVVGEMLPPVWPSSDSDSGSSVATTSTNRHKRVDRTEYTRAECQHILDVILKYDLSQFVSGHNVWKLLLSSKLLYPNQKPRTFQSLNNMFRKKVMPDLEKNQGHGFGIYRCSREDFKKYEHGRKVALRQRVSCITDYEFKLRVSRINSAKKNK